MNRRSAVYMAGGLVLLLVGYWFYGVARPNVMSSTLSLEMGSANGMPSWLLASFPSFLHLLAFAFIAYALLGAQGRWRFPVAAVSLALGAGLELSQYGLTAGTFDVLDLLAQLVAVACFLVVTHRFSFNFSSPLSKGQFWLIVPLVVTGVLTTTASSSPEPDYEPVYMSYDELRQPLLISHHRPLGENGKIYLYGDYLFVNEPNKGIHVFNNADPSAPIAMYFINLPGNVDISIRNNHIFADSFIDLVSIDISNIDTPVIVSRQQDVFAYDGYQAIPDGISIGWVYQSRGVVVGYRERN